MVPSSTQAHPGNDCVFETKVHLPCCCSFQSKFSMPFSVSWYSLLMWFMSFLHCRCIVANFYCVTCSKLYFFRFMVPDMTDCFTICWLCLWYYCHLQFPHPLKSWWIQLFSSACYDISLIESISKVFGNAPWLCHKPLTVFSSAWNLLHSLHCHSCDELLHLPVFKGQF